MGDLFPAAGVEGRERLGSRNAFDHRDLPGHLASVHKGDIPPAFVSRAAPFPARSRASLGCLDGTRDRSPSPVRSKRPPRAPHSSQPSVTSTQRALNQQGTTRNLRGFRATVLPRAEITPELTRGIPEVPRRRAGARKPAWDAPVVRSTSTPRSGSLLQPFTPKAPHFSLPIIIWTSLPGTCHAQLPLSPPASTPGVPGPDLPALPPGAKKGEESRKEPGTAERGTRGEGVN